MRKACGKLPKFQAFLADFLDEVDANALRRNHYLYRENLAKMIALELRGCDPTLTRSERWTAGSLRGRRRNRAATLSPATNWET